MNMYTRLKDKHSKMINDFPMAFAFSEKQFEEAKEKLGVKSNDELLSIPSGGMIRKIDSEALNTLYKTMNRETEEAQKDDVYMYQGFLYELGNHEYIYTGDPEQTLECFNLTIEEVNKDIRLLTIFKKARAEYWETAEA